MREDNLTSSKQRGNNGNSILNKNLFYLIFDPRNFEQLKDQKRELEVSLKTNFEFFFKVGSLDQIWFHQKKFISIISKIK